MSKKRGPNKRADSKVSTSIRVSPDTLARLRATGNASATVERLVRGATPTITERPTCETCVYWTRIGTYPDGTCRRTPPGIVSSEFQRWRSENGASALATYWPETEQCDWCGEHPNMNAYLASRVDQPQPPAQ